MKSQTNELALETAIEKALCGISTEDIKNGIVAEPTEAYGGQGYQIGYPTDFNPKYALDEARFWNFLENTQKDELEKLIRQREWKIKRLKRYDISTTNETNMRLL